jgi:Flp pilus assembly secretin CpaC
VGQVPNTIKRTLNAEIAVRNRDTVMLGGFIKANKSTSRSGVPFLMNIPILGNLFLQRNDSKQREELIVLMRPTVLDTPKMAAEYTYTEEKRLPGVAGAEFDNAGDESKLIDAERKREMRAHKADHSRIGFFTEHPEDTSTNNVKLDITKPQTNSVEEAEPETDGEPVKVVPQAIHPQGEATPPAAEAAPANMAPPLDQAAQQKKSEEALQKALQSGSGNTAH